MNRVSTKTIIILLFFVIAISVTAANYPTYYVIYHSGLSAFFSPVPITQYSLRMSLLILIAILAAVLDLILVRRYYKTLKGMKKFTFLSLMVIILSFIENYPSYYVVYHHGLRSIFDGVVITQYSVRTTAILGLVLVFLAASFLTFIREAPKVAPVQKEVHEEMQQISEEELMRLKLWRSRAQNSRLLGLIMLLLSAALFILAYETVVLVYEIGSLAAFIIGAALILTQVEPKIKLYPASDTSLGPLLAVAGMLKSRYGRYKVMFRADNEGDKMFILQEGASDNTNLTLEPIGEGLVRSYERELGELNGKGEEYIESWLSKTLSQGLGLAETAKIVFEDGEMHCILHKPFVRTLCVQNEMANQVCNSMGCPLIASLAQSAAKATGKSLIHLECKYDPSAQTAVSRHKVED